VGRYEWAPFGGRGRPFRVTQTHLKNYPAVLHAQSPIAAAIELHGQMRIEDIASVTVNTYWVADRYLDRSKPDWRPSTRETADHSIPYIVAAAIIDGQITPATFTEKRIHDPQLRSLLEKMSVVELPEFTAAYPDGCPCRIEIVSKTGLRKVASAKYFKGHARNPLSDGEVETKFRQMADGLVDAQHVDAILQSLWHCEEIKDIAEVLQRFVIKGQLGQPV
jgi:2-methylcitrate dehydratase